MVIGVFGANGVLATLHVMKVTQEDGALVLVLLQEMEANDVKGCPKRERHVY